MMTSSQLARLLCERFCSEIVVQQVPCGYAISTSFSDNSGDRIGFYAVNSEDGWRFEDDGDYLATLIARGIPITDGVRGNLLTGILGDAEAFWDHDSLEIRTNFFEEKELSNRIVPFLSSLIRVRDLELLTRENVRSTFREDVIREAQDRFKERVTIEEDSFVARDFSEFPADIVLRPKTTESVPAAVYLVNTTDKLNEALLAHQELMLTDRNDFKVIGLIEDADMKGISRKKFQRAQNRRLLMPIFRGDEDSALALIQREMRLTAH